MTPEQHAADIVGPLYGAIPEWQVQHVRGRIEQAVRAAEFALRESLPCGHPAACLEECDADEDKAGVRCGACERERDAVLAEHHHMLKLASVEREPLPCGHPTACLEEYDDSEDWLFDRPEDAGPALRCAACRMQKEAVQAEQLRVLKLAEEGAYVVHDGHVRFSGLGQIGILTVYGGSVYFENPPLEQLADPYTVTGLNVPATPPSPASGPEPG